jgi:hypothetical protein
MSIPVMKIGSSKKLHRIDVTFALLELTEGFKDLSPEE